MRCDQCEMATIQGVPCHERGCPNRKSRWDTATRTWVKQRTCFICGCRCDADDECCNAEPEETNVGTEPTTCEDDQLKTAFAICH